MFTALAENFGNLEDKLNLFVALAPVTRLDGVKNQFYHNLGNVFPYLKQVLDDMHIYEFYGPSWQSYEDEICFLFTDLCDQLNVLNIPTDDDSIDELIARVANQRPMTSIGVKQTLHFGQIKASGHFAQYDEMSEEANQAKYHRDTPPDINLKKISNKVPIAMFVGNDDDLATVRNAEWIRSEIGKDTVFSLKTLENFGHATFNFGKDRDYLDDIHSYLKTYNPIIRGTQGAIYA